MINSTIDDVVLYHLLYVLKYVIRKVYHLDIPEDKKTIFQTMEKEVDFELMRIDRSVLPF